MEPSSEVTHLPPKPFSRILSQDVLCRYFTGLGMGQTKKQQGLQADELRKFYAHTDPLNPGKYLNNFYVGEVYGK